MHAQGYYTITDWQEAPYEEPAGQPKLSRAQLTQAFHGDLEGESTSQYLMAYLDDGSAAFVGLLRVTGRLGGRSGSFVVRQSGIYGADGVQETWQIVPGSGTGELRGLTGAGTMRTNEDRRATYTLDYEFE